VGVYKTAALMYYSCEKIRFGAGRHMGNVTGNMTASEIQQTASLISVLAVALIGVALVVSTASWKRWITRYRRMLLFDQYRAKRPVQIAMATLALIVFVGFFVALVSAPHPYRWTLSVIATMVFGILAVGGVLLIHIIGYTKRDLKFYPLTFGALICYFGSWTFLVVSVGYAIYALAGVTSVALGYDILGNFTSFEQGRYLLSEGVFCFAVGVLTLGFGAVAEFLKSWLLPKSS
jgi:hypothetical protein